jgi:hypothetical protein
MRADVEPQARRYTKLRHYCECSLLFLENAGVFARKARPIDDD